MVKSVIPTYIIEDYSMKLKQPTLAWQNNRKMDFLFFNL